jgi:hypothetical protein
MHSVRQSRWIAAELLEPFLHLLCGWIRGNVDWAVSSDRYGLGGARIDSPIARQGSHAQSGAVMQVL